MAPDSPSAAQAQSTPAQASPLSVELSADTSTGYVAIQNHVPADTPPTFMALAADDTTVIPLPNAGAYYVALQTAKIPSEIHLFEAGGHGFGLARTVGRPTAVWPDLLLRWGQSHGYFKA